MGEREWESGSGRAGEGQGERVRGRLRATKYVAAWQQADA